MLRRPLPYNPVRAAVHKIVPHQIIRHRLHVQYHAAAEDRRQQSIHIGGQQHDHCVLGRLFQRFQDRILRLGRHLLCLVHNIDLIGTAVWLDGDIIVDLRTNIVYADGIRLLMADIDNIRLIVRQRLFTGMTFLTGLCAAFSHCNVMANTLAINSLPEDFSPLIIYAWEIFFAEMAFCKCSLICS